MIYKVVAANLWKAATSTGVFYGSEDDLRDGFVHLSAANQLLSTVEKHFRGQPDLLLAAFEESDLQETLKWEPSRGGALFPHNYGPLKTSQALWVRTLKLGENGVPKIDANWLQC